MKGAAAMSSSSPSNGVICAILSEVHPDRIVLGGKTLDLASAMECRLPREAYVEGGYVEQEGRRQGIRLTAMKGPAEGDGRGASHGGRRGCLRGIPRGARPVRRARRGRRRRAHLASVLVRGAD